MKFTYNGKTYVVFATALEIIDQNLIIRVQDDYLELSALVLNQSYSHKDCIKEDALFKLTTTQVLKHYNNKKKILQAHTLKTIDKVVDNFYADDLSGELTDTLELFMRLSKQYNKAKITFVSDCSNEYYVITRSTEEIEEEAKTRLGCNWNKVKYYEP